MKYINRRNTNSTKWDGQTGMYGEEGLHPMWVADMDFQVPACVQEALHEYVEMGVFGYYRIPDSYYQACIDWEAENHGYVMQKEWICFSPGVVSAFNWIIQFMTDPGDSVIVMTPVYYPFLNAVKNNNRKLVTSDLINNEGVYTIDFKDFENKIIENETKLFILCSPHNPVGRVWTKDELKKTFDICRKHNVFVISDEIHQDLTYKNKHVPSFSVGDYEDMMISIMAPSKTFNLAGAQNSEVIIPNENLRERWYKYINGIRVTGGNAFGYVAAEAAYQGGKDWLEEVKAQIYTNYTFLCNELKEHFPQILVSPLEGTYLSWVDLSAYVKPEEMKDFIQNKCRLAVDYGDWFGGTRFKGFIRLNLATSLENVKTTTDAIINNLK
jgi:cystathionine beta-lyase